MPTPEETRELIEQANIVCARAEESLERIEALADAVGVRRRPHLRLVDADEDENS